MSSRANGSVSRAAEAASKNRLRMDRNPQHSRITDPANPAGRRKEIDNVMKRARQASPGSWDRKLLEIEKKDPNRWRHTGYKQLYLDGGGSVSPRRSRSPVLGRRSRSPLPAGRRSRSPLVLRRSRSPIGRRSRSPMGRRSRSPIGRRSRSPIGRRSRSPIGRRSRSSRRSPRKSRSRSSRRTPKRSPRRSPIRRSPLRSPRRKASPRPRTARPLPPPRGARPPSPPDPRKSSPSGSSVSSCSDESCSVCSAKNKKVAPPKPVKPSSTSPARTAPSAVVKRPPVTRAVQPTRELLKAREASKRTREEKVLEWQRSQLGVAGAPAAPAARIKREGERRRERPERPERTERGERVSPAAIAAALAESESDSDSDSSEPQPQRLTLSERFGKMAQWSADRSARLENMRITRREATLHVRIEPAEPPEGPEPAPPGSYPEELLGAAPGGLPSWDDVRVRYDYYKKRGYLRGLTLGDYVKWEEWWYKYQDWLKRERAYEQWAEGEIGGTVRRERRRRGGRHRRS